MGNSPCKGCEDRKLLCHSQCDRFREWKAAMAVIAAQREAARKSKPDLARETVRQIWKKERWR